MQETSKIKIDISKGTYVTLVTSTKKKKNTQVSNAVACASEIKNFIQSESLLSKLKKRIDQQNKRDSRLITKVVTSELNIECLIQT